MRITLGDEKAILGYMLYRHLDSPLITEQSFRYDKHRDLYRVIMKLKKAGKVVDCVTIEEEIRGKEKNLGFTLTYLMDLDKALMQGKYAEIHFNDHVHSLLKENRKQETLHTFQKAVELSNTEDPWPEFKKLTEKWSVIELDMKPIEDYSLAANADELKEFIEKRRLGKLWGLEIESLPRLTEITMGLRHLAVFGGDEKAGKSTLALQIATDVADLGCPVFYFDYENGRKNLEARIICRKEKLQYKEELLNSQFEGRDNSPISAEELISAGIEKFKESYKHFHIIPGDTDITPEKMKSLISQAREALGPDTWVLIVIDSLQKLIKNKLATLGNRRDAMDLWIWELADMAVADDNLAILAISELSRKDRDFKESGDIEYSGHFLFKLTYDQKREVIEKIGDNGIRKLYLEFARDLPRGEIRLGSDFKLWTFEEL